MSTFYSIRIPKIIFAQQKLYSHNKNHIHTPVSYIRTKNSHRKLYLRIKDRIRTRVIPPAPRIQILVCRIKHKSTTSILHKNIEYKLVLVGNSGSTRSWIVLRFFGAQQLSSRFIKLFEHFQNYSVFSNCLHN